MKHQRWRGTYIAGCAGIMLIGGVAKAQGVAAAPAEDTVDAGVSTAAANARKELASTQLSEAIRKSLEVQAERLDAMRSEIAMQDRQIAAMKRMLAAQEADYRALRHRVGLDVLDQQRGGDAGAAGSTAPMPAVAGQPDVAPVGRAPEGYDRPPAVAPIFDQPGVLTPKGKLVVEPSYQFGYSSVDRVDLIGYTVIPAILIGLIDARQVKTTTQTAAVAMRYGLTNRLEVELRVPYVYAHTDTVSREIFTGSAENKVFTTSGHGLGDIEATARYQFNDGGADKPYYVGWLRFKSRTGTDLFDVTTDCVTRCVQNATGTGLPLRQPTGSGFYSLQPGLTWLYPSDPVVFFGNVSYLHNFSRNNVSLTVLGGGKQPLGRVKLGDIVDASVGMGLALNDRASISIGYDQSWVGTTRQNNHRVAGSAKTVLGTLLLGGSYKLSDKRTLNFTLGVGVTRDTPDATVTVRMPTMY